MEINIKLNRNFTIAYNRLLNEYGTEMAAINGFSDEQLSYTDFIDNFVCSATVADASIDGTGGLVISGRLTQGVLERYILQYVQMYVKCPVCGAMDTNLEKKDRLLFIVCNSCTAKNSVQQIKAGYKANTTKRAKRATK